MSSDKDVYCNRKDYYLTISRAEREEDNEENFVCIFFAAQNQFTDDKKTKHNQSVEWRRDFYFFKTAKSHHRVD